MANRIPEPFDFAAWAFDFLTDVNRKLAAAYSKDPGRIELDDPEELDDEDGPDWEDWEDEDEEDDEDDEQDDPWLADLEAREAAEDAEADYRIRMAKDTGAWDTDPRWH